MSTQELNKWLDSLGDEEVESTFAASQAISGEPLENTFEYRISLDDFTDPEIQIENNDDMQTGDNDNIGRKDHHNSSDIEMSTNDKLVTDQSPHEGPFDCHPLQLSRFLSLRGLGFRTITGVNNLQVRSKHT